MFRGEGGLVEVVERTPNVTTRPDGQTTRCDQSVTAHD